MFNKLLSRFESSRFWISYLGIAAIGAIGCLLLAGYATLLLLFRQAFEPLTSFAFDLVVDIVSRRRGDLSYTPDKYPWVVACIYGLSGLWVGLTAYSLYRRPAADRRLDAHFKRKLQLETPYVASRDPEAKRPE